MAEKITVTELFQPADLRACGPVPWDERVTEPSPGIYVIATVSHPNDAGDFALDVGNLDAQIAKRWIGQPVIYIGRTKRSLSRRIAEFYRHKHDARGPHRGGQDVLLLKMRTLGLLGYDPATRRSRGRNDRVLQEESGPIAIR